VDEKALAEAAADPSHQYRWRGAHYYPDGSVADY
jgi:hypothetical protein